MDIKGLITQCVVSLAFFIFLAFLIFPRVLCWYQKRKEKRKKNARKLANARKTQEHFSILHYALGKRHESVAFFFAFWNV